MIGTRDFVLFLVTLVFLLFGITTTLTATPEAPREVTLQDSVVYTEATAPETATLDRQSIIDRLRSAIHSESFAITPQPSVIATAPTTDDADPSSNEGGAAQYCGGDDVLPYISRWPVGGSNSEIVEGARVYSAAVATQVGTTTVTSTEKLLTLPVAPTSQANYCLPSEVVGVTNEGDLLFTTDVALHVGTRSTELIGIARDGYPIYGSYDGELDECGGYQHPAGYRYSVSPNREVIISCFRAEPQPFTF